MTSNFSDPSSAVVGDILSRTGSAGYEEWWAKVVDSGFCAAPVRLEARSAHLPTEVFARCKNRRASVCPSCSQLYAGDTWRLVHAGIVGEDDQPMLTGHPMVFVTLTAPSFGPVHSTGPFVGEPSRPDRYDYVGHVLFTWHAPRSGTGLQSDFVGWSSGTVVNRRGLLGPGSLTSRWLNYNDERSRTSTLSSASTMRRASTPTSSDHSSGRLGTSPPSRYAHEGER